MAKLLYVNENIVKTDMNNSNMNQFCNYLNSKNLNVEVITTENEQNANVEYLGNQIPLVRLKSTDYRKRKIFFPLSYLFSHRNEYDFIWCYLSRAATCYSTMISKLFNKKLIIKCDSVIPLPSTNIIQAMWRKLTITWPLKNADLIICESPRVLDAITPLNKNTVLLPNCVDLSVINHLDADVKKQNIILSAGRMGHVKGLMDLIDAFFIFNQNTNWILNIVGPVAIPEDVEDIKNRIKELWPDQNNCPVKLLGPKWKDDLYVEMQKAKIFVIASHPLGDGFNNTLPYAIYFGCTPIVTDVGDLKFQIKDLPGSKLISPKNVKQLSKELYNVSMAPGDPKELKEYILKNFSWNTYLHQLNVIKQWANSK
jgi:glycosyltransferase involved in cell wall biosynthesis